MKAFVIGQTGLLGYHATLEMLKDGHEVNGIGVTPAPQGGIFKSLVKYEQMDVRYATDKELFNRFSGNDWLLCAFSASSHTVYKKPISDYYTNFNIYTIERILRIARDAKIKKVILLSNYFEYFNIEWSYMGLSSTHPYVKCISQQGISARKFSLTNFQVVVLQLPMVFGIMPKRKPYDYEAILEKIKSKDFSYFKGGTAVMTVKQVSQAILGAFKYGKGGKSYPLAGDNMKYEEINRIYIEATGLEDVKYKPKNKFLYKLKQKKKMRMWKHKGLEPGINPVKIVSFYQKDAYINPNIAMKLLKVQPDNVREQIAITAKRVFEIAKENKEIK